MKTDYQLLAMLQIRQLERVLDTFKKTKFDLAYYVIFSDAPTANSIRNLIMDDEIEMNGEIRILLTKEFIRLSK